MSKQAYFVVVVEEDGTAWIDDERAAAIMPEQDVWVESEPDWDNQDQWVSMYDESRFFEVAREKLGDLLRGNNS
jgi:hypothetical protein